MSSSPCRGIPAPPSPSNSLPLLTPPIEMTRSQPPQKSKPSAPKPKPTGNSKPKGGKPAAKAAAPAPPALSPSSKGKAKGDSQSVDALRQEILDLGGDDEDYAMLQNIDEGDGEVLGGDDEVVDVSVRKLSSSSPPIIIQSSLVRPSFLRVASISRPSFPRSSLPS